jgi:hypothetical protein
MFKLYLVIKIKIYNIFYFLKKDEQSNITKKSITIIKNMKGV